MKKLLSVLLFVAVCSIPAHAQKTVVKVLNTQARVLDMNSNAYVKPVVVELRVDPEKKKDVWHLTREEIEIALQGDIANIRNWGANRSSEEYDCDVMVAATFKIESDDSGGYNVTVTGYPGHYTHWETATEEDYEWIRIEIGQPLEREKGAVSIRR
ncbi:MAG: hypothetical protein LUD76_00805 [Alistipes sp.]|nr:hypothetical protein [Alistipes sp.]